MVIKNTLLKSNKLITAKHNLTLIQSKFIALMASKIKPDSTNLVFNTQDVLKTLGIGSKDHKALYKNINTIMRKVIEVKTDKSFSMFTMLHHFKHEFKEDTIFISFDKEFTPFLIALKEKFTILDLPKILNARSSYTIKFYEIIQMKIQQYHKYKNDNCLTFKYEYKELRELFLIDDNKYKLFDAFNRKILKVAQAELKNNYKYYFEYNLIKKMRKVVAIEFEVIENIKKQEEKHTQFEQKENESLEKYIERVFYFTHKNKINNLVKTEHKKIKEQSLDGLCCTQEEFKKAIIYYVSRNRYNEFLAYKSSLTEDKKRKVSFAFYFTKNLITTAEIEKIYSRNF